MPDEFVSEGISSRVLVMEDNSSEYKSYGANLAKNNEENNLYHAIGSASINKLGIFVSYIYKNVNKSRQIHT